MPGGPSALDRLISRLGDVTNDMSPNGEETLLGRLAARLRQLERRIDDESAALLSRLTARDEELLRSARRLYHACSVVPCLLYYLRTSESPTKFPATISFTIRKGVPRWTHHALWLAGWACMGRVFQSAGSAATRRFAAAMFATGIWTTFIFRLGGGLLSDAAHLLGAAAYMVDHEVLLRLWAVAPPYRAAFRASLGVLLAAFWRGHLLERRHGISAESFASPAVRRRQIAAAPRTAQRSLFRADLAIMLSENLLFSAFVQGMLSGVEARRGGGGGRSGGGAGDETSGRCEDGGGKGKAVGEFGEILHH